MKKIGKFIWAFLIVLVVFIAAGFATLGNAVNTGESLSYVANKTVMYSFGGSSKKLDAVYVNIGAIYTDYGNSAEIEVEYTNSSSPSKTSGTDVTAKFKLSNISSEVGKNGYNYNWLPVVEGKGVSARYIYFKATANLDLNEIVCLDTDGNVISLMPYTNNNGYKWDELQAGCDAQESFTQSLNAYYNLSQEEAMSMTAVHTLLGGNAVMSGSVYNLDDSFGILATAFMAVPVAVFGNSAFAIRFAPFIATCVSLVFLFLLCKDLFKSEKYAFYASVLFAIGGLATSVGRMGAAYSMVFSAILGSAYFMYRFFSRGISSSMPIKGGLNILFSGAFAAVAICMEIFAVLPVLGVVVLFVFGMLRMKAAHRLATEKLSESETEENTDAKARLQSDYAYKKRVAIGFTALSFVAMTLLITLLTGVFAYSALVKAYDNATAPSMSFLTLLWKALSDSATVSFQTPYASASASAIVSWLLPLQPATIYSASSGSEYLAWNACINIAACVAAFASFIFVTVKAIMDMVKKKTDKAALRIRRVWILLLSGMALSMLAAALKGNSSILSGLLFTACYLAFIPAAAMALEGSLQEERKGWIDVALYAVLGLSAIVFCLSVPSMYGAAIPAAAANIFGWTSILNNGYFRV